jgi:uncharacterized protein (TIGR03067 family)
MMKAYFFKYLTILLVLILSGSPANSQDKSKEIQKVQDDMKVLQGDWFCIMEETGGQSLTKDKVKEMNKRMNVDKSFMIMKRVKGDKLGVYEGKFELDSTTKPKKFDFTGKGPSGANVEWKGIYELTENEFKITLVEKGLRPKEFKTGKDEKGTYMQFKRDKD